MKNTPLSKGAEEVKPYDAGSAKGAQVEAMFDSIAPAYDTMNSTMTFGLHRRWLRKALEAAEAGSPENIIDLATGTGDVAFRLGRMFPGARITGLDLSEGMLTVARKKLEEDDRLSMMRDRVRFETGDCLAIDKPADSFDFLTIAYGLRNFENLARGLSEFHRILKPGGKCMILELSRPENRIVRLGYDLYSKGIIPLIGRMVSKDRRAYSYLPESIAAMPPRRRIAAMLEDAGFRKVKYKSLTLGVVTYYIAEK